MTAVAHVTSDQRAPRFLGRTKLHPTRVTPARVTPARVTPARFEPARFTSVRVASESRSRGRVRESNSVISCADVAPPMVEVVRLTERGLAVAVGAVGIVAMTALLVVLRVFLSFSNAPLS